MSCQWYFISILCEFKRVWPTSSITEVFLSKIINSYLFRGQYLLQDSWKQIEIHTYADRLLHSNLKPDTEPQVLKDRILYFSCSRTLISPFHIWLRVSCIHRSNDTVEFLIHGSRNAFYLWLSLLDLILATTDQRLPHGTDSSLFSIFAW